MVPMTMTTNIEQEHDVPRVSMGGSPSPSALMRIRELEQALRTVHSATICALCQLLDLKDLGTGYHCTRLAEWGVRLASAMGLAPAAVRGVEAAALLHDIGKVGVNDSILHKTGALTDDEWVLMRKHPEFGWCILRLFPELEQAALFVLHHHERHDGTGYPAGLEGDEIPLGARIVSVIDAFDAMISTRPYRRGMPFDEVMLRLEAGSGTQFDPTIVRRFTELARAEWSMAPEETRLPAMSKHMDLELASSI